MFTLEGLNSTLHPGNVYGHSDPRMSFTKSPVNKMALVLITNLGLEHNMWLTNLQNELCFVGLSCFIVLFVYVEVMFRLFK